MGGALGRAERRCDVLVIGAGAAGMTAALAARGALDRDGAARPVGPGAPDVVLLNNEARLGLKILVSGGARCNVTNERVVEQDYVTDAPHLLRGLLRAFPSTSARAMFERAGVALYAEPMGKLFPRSDDARDVLGALLRAVDRAGISLVAPVEVVDLAPPARPGAGEDARWTALTSDGSPWLARRVILATGGKSLPKTGSRGFGLEAAARLGLEVEPPLPALTPLLLEAGGPLEGLAGLTVPLVLTLAPRGAPPEQVEGARFRPLARAAGSVLVTHKGATGPAALDVSGPCGRSLLRGEAVTLEADAWTLPGADAWVPFKDLPKAPGASLAHDEAPRPTPREAFVHSVRALDPDGARSLVNALSLRVPRALVVALLAPHDVDATRPLRQIDAGAWSRVHRALVHADLRLRGTDGYAKAEVTTGGVLLGALERTTLEARARSGLFLCGEVVNVTGRLGGFNFQWAWSSGFAAGRGAAASLVAGSWAEPTAPTPGAP